jgi:lipid-A-disaccharide synthase
MNIFISAGDASGDIHAANLARSLRKLGRDVHIAALGGEQLKKECDEFLYNLVEVGGFGFWQPFKLYFKLKNVLTDIAVIYFERQKPDKVIIVDYYGFNIHIAKEASRRNIPVYYYISPQVWATRPGRVKTIGKYVKKMLAVLPFEEKLYRDAGIEAVFVGNPLIDMVPEPATWPAAVPDRICIGLFPGSRPNVFRRHIGLLMETAGLIKAGINADFKIFCVPALAEKCKGLPYPCVVEADYGERKKITLAITPSGTVSTENALLGIPMVVYYKLSGFNYAIAKLLANVKYVTMVNILLGRMLVPELLQKDATPAAIAGTALRLLKDAKELDSLREGLLGIRGRLGQPGVADRAAGIILS